MSKTVRAILVNIRTTLCGVAMLVMGISAQTELLPPSWKQPLQIGAVISGALMGVLARDGEKTSKQTLGK